MERLKDWCVCVCALKHLIMKEKEIFWLFSASLSLLDVGDDNTHVVSCFLHNDIYFRSCMAV